MNDKNKALLFDDNEEDGIELTLTDETGNDYTAEVIASIEIEELGKEFVAVLPTQPVDDLDENEALILEYSENWKGEPEFAPVEDEELFDIAMQAFNQFFESELEDEMLEEDDEEEDYEEDDDDYLSGEIIPGVRIKN